MISIYCEELDGECFDSHNCESCEYNTSNKHKPLPSPEPIISKKELIEEIKAQLQALETIADVKNAFELSETMAMFDLQFRLKCKLYELTKEG